MLSKAMNLNCFKIVAIVFLVLLIFSFSELLAQKGSRINLSNGSINTSKLVVYKEGYVIKSIDRKITEVLNNCPEQLLQSVLSASSQEWIDYNTYGGNTNSDKKSEKHFNAVKSMNRDSTYFEPNHSFYYEIGGVTYCIVKYYIHLGYSKNPVSAVICMLEDRGRWYVVKNIVSGPITMMFMRFKTDKLSDLFFNPEKDEMLNALYKKVAVNNKIDIDKLAVEYNSWYEVGNENLKKYFIDEKAW